MHHFPDIDAINKYYAQFIQNSEPLTPPPTNCRDRYAPFPCPSPLKCTSRLSLSAHSASQSKEFEDNSIIDIINLSEDHNDVLFWAVVWIANDLIIKREWVT